MTLEKGAMVFHMLRWEIGDKAFLATLKGALSQYTDQSMRTSDFDQGRRSAKPAATHRLLLPVDRRHRRAAFTDKYAVYRLGNNKGFRTIGEIHQDLDLFRMPVDLRVETDGKTERPEDRRGRHRHAICSRYLRPPPPHQHRSQRLAAQIHA